MVCCWQQTSSPCGLCYCAILWRCESPIPRIGGIDKGPLPLVQMSKAFMKISNVIQTDPNNKDLLCFAQTQSESLWLRLLSPSLLIDKQLRETADCSAIITKCRVISNMVQSNVVAFPLLCFVVGVQIQITSVIGFQSSSKLFPGLLSLSFLLVS